VKVIKAFASEETYTRFFHDALSRRFTTEIGVVKLETLMQLIYQYIDYVAQIALVFVGGLMVTRRTISIGTFYAFYNYLNMLIYPVLDIPQLFVFGKRAFVNIDRLEEMRTYEPEAAQQGEKLAQPEEVLSGKKVNTKASFHSLSFDGVSVRYEHRRKPALSDISFSIEPGEKLLVIGPVGSGKSTLIKIALGLLEPYRGQVTIDERPVQSLLPSELRGLIGYVPQDPLLFSGTIRENILLAAEMTKTLAKRSLIALFKLRSCPKKLLNFQKALRRSSANVVQVYQADKNNVSRLHGHLPLTRRSFYSTI